MVDQYVKFAKTIINRYHNDVKYWLNFNEINMLTKTLGTYLSGGMYVNNSNIFNNTKVDTMQLRYQALYHQFIASVEIVGFGTQF